MNIESICNRMVYNDFPIFYFTNTAQISIVNVYNAPAGDVWPQLDLLVQLSARIK